MKYETSIAREAGDAVLYLNKLIGEKKKVEVKEVKPRRSLSQNSYLHLLLGYFGSCLGYSLEESKWLYKRLPGNKELYEYEKDVGGKPMTFMRSSAELNKEEMTKTIETLRDWSGRMGYPLPSAEDKEGIVRLERYIEQNERYM